MTTERTALIAERPTQPADIPAAIRAADLSVTALYTSGTWRWAKVRNADLLATRQGQQIFVGTNLFLAIQRLFRWGMPRLPEGLAQRHRAIDLLTEESVRNGAPQVIELACGLSPRGLTFSEDPTLTVTEVDLPPVIALKTTILNLSGAGQAALNRPNYQLVPGDLKAFDLSEVHDASMPAVVIAEGLHIYLDADARAGFWRRIVHILRQSGGRFIFDYLPPADEPKPGLLGRALTWMMSKFTGGQGFITDGTTAETIERNLRNAGFDDVRSMVPNAPDSKDGWTVPYPKARTLQRVWIAECSASGAPTAGVQDDLAINKSSAV